MGCWSRLGAERLKVLLLDLFDLATEFGESGFELLDLCGKHDWSSHAADAFGLMAMRSPAAVSF